jgi:ADP-heptose:LPS heptosyltransferase
VTSSPRGESMKTNWALPTSRAAGLVTDLAPRLSDFAETAAAVAHLDLLITVDTAVAHVAGALARPAWVMLRARLDWRWLPEREDSPWYPTLRLFRQRERGDWGEVVARVRAALERARP